MNLRRRERRALAEIGRLLEADDPDLARALSAPTCAADRIRRAAGSSLLVGGLALLVTGLALSAPELVVVAVILLLCSLVPWQIGRKAGPGTEGRRP